MAGFVESTVNDIDSRMEELRTELAALEAARSALVGSDGGRRRGARSTQTASRATRTRRRSPRPSGRGRRQGGNTRAAQALELVRNKPGITIPQIAASMSIEPNYLYRVMPRLESEGQVRREGQGWHSAS